jgi:hypothetical protein
MDDKLFGCHTATNLKTAELSKELIPLTGETVPAEGVKLQLPRGIGPASDLREVQAACAPIQFIVRWTEQLEPKGNG